VTSKNWPYRGEILQLKRARYLTHLPLPLYSHFPAELASIMHLPFSLFTSVATLSHCLCSESPYLSVKLYRIYVCYTNITLFIYSVQYYPLFHVTDVVLGTYYLRIWGHTYIFKILIYVCYTNIILYIAVGIIRSFTEPR
jgi:hypothetical protein